LLKALATRWQRRTTTEVDARLAALRAGHPAVIEEVLLELSPRIRGWCYRRVGPDAALDDVMQEVLIELARALPRFEGQSSLVTYAYRICARSIVRHQKRARRESPRGHASAHVEPDLTAHEDRDPEQTSIERQALRAVLACLNRLPERRREAFVLCELEGETAEQAARMLGTTPNAVRSRLMHARRELERRLQGHDALKLVRRAQ
jgi:RNA polymerase sigma-70 factor (ECF subfamily)